MSGKFLRAAFRILDGESRPLDAAVIVDIARKKGFLHTGGKTPTNTMRARLSDDIRTRGAESVFQRIGPNRFGLRSWDFPEYHAAPFRRPLPSEVTVCVPGTIQQVVEAPTLWYSPISQKLQAFLRDPANLSYVDRRTAETTSQYKQIIAYVWLETIDGHVLAYTRGKYSSAHPTLLLGRRSVGFGGHVLQQDAEDIFGAEDAGLRQAAIRETFEELGLAPSDLHVVGTIWDDSSYEGQKHIGIVLKGVVPQANALPKRSGERSINQLQVLAREQLWEQFHAMEFWSQLLIRQFAAGHRPANVSTIVPPRKPAQVRHVALVGEIANGKSWLASALSARLGFSTVSASAALRRLLGVAEMSERDRLTFQSKALAFIKGESGPSRLAQEISEAVLRAGGRTIVDGIRQIATLDELRSLLPDLIVVYIDAPRDMAYEHYRTRLPGATVLDFAAVREHEVESELPLFRFEADAVLNNADSKEQSLTTLCEWLES